MLLYQLSSHGALRVPYATVSRVRDPHMSAPLGLVKHLLLWVNVSVLLLSACSGGRDEQGEPAPAPSVSISASPSTVASGGTSTLTWDSSGATGCNASGSWSGARNPSGSSNTGALTANAAYTLTCTGAGGSASSTVSVTVAGATPVPTVTLSATPVSVSIGGSSTLAWTSTDADSCTASGGWAGPRDFSGSASVGPISISVTYTLTCTGAGGSAASSATVSIISTSGRYPLRVETGSRHLVDASGNPFLMVGDTPWSLIVMLTDGDVDLYLNDRKDKGFNTILVNLIEHEFATNAPKDAYGNAPFTSTGDYSTPNEAYFARAAAIVQKALNRDMLVLLTPSYMGFGGGSQGWYQEMLDNGPTNLRMYGRYLANRFAAYPNIIWVNGGDYDPPNRDVLDAIANGINDVSTMWLQTFHGARQTSALNFVNSSETWLTLNNIYTDDSTVAQRANEQYAKSTMPFFLIEAGYEGAASASIVRMQAYQALLSGATGQMMGDDPVWYFGAGWQNALTRPGASSMRHLRALFESHNWTLLRPNSSDGSRAIASNGSFEILYLRSGAGTIDLSQLSGPNVRARWYDPTNGTYTTVTGSPFAASGSRSLTRGAGNSQGDGDWVLVLESQL